MDNTSFQSSDVLSTAPPPPPEVKVRTMRSDLESMAKSGGGMPKFTNVKVSGLVAGKEISSSDVVRASSKKTISGIVIGLIVLIIVAVIGWFAYRYLSGQRPTIVQSQNQTPPAPTQSNPVAIPTTTPTVPQAPVTPPINPVQPAPTQPVGPLVHASFFKIPADQVLKLNLPGAGGAQNATDLQTFNQKLLALLSTAKKTAVIIEIDAKSSAGNDAGVNDLLTAASAQVIDPSFLAGNFNPDPTFFAFRDSNGFWPGIILGVNNPANQSSLQGSVAKLESSPDISNFFLNNAGVPSSSGFADATLASSSVRILAFSGGSAPSSFVYGWSPDNKYLILSTSKAGFTAAMKRLGE